MNLMHKIIGSLFSTTLLLSSLLVAKPADKELQKLVAEHNYKKLSSVIKGKQLSLSNLKALAKRHNATPLSMQLTQQLILKAEKAL